jgi:hypothetical protein
VHAADPARSHEPDVDRSAHGECAPDRRCTDGALRDARSEVTWPDLACGAVEADELVLGEADDDLAVENADRRRDGARGAHPLLGLQPHGEAFPGGKAVRDERRLERDDRPGLAHFVSDSNHASSCMSMNGTSPQPSQ